MSDQDERTLVARAAWWGCPGGTLASMQAALDAAAAWDREHAPVTLTDAVVERAVRAQYESRKLAVGGLYTWEGMMDSAKRGHLDAMRAALETLPRAELPAVVTDAMIDAFGDAWSKIGFEWPECGTQVFRALLEASLSAAPPQQPHAPVPIVLENYRAAWQAIRMIREAVETLGPVGCMRAGEEIDAADGPEPHNEAAEIIKGIQAIADRQPQQPHGDKVRALVEAAKALLQWAERNTCAHEETHRGGVLWTICDQCGRKWADDQGGFKPYSDPLEFVNVTAALAAFDAPAGEPDPVRTAAPDERMQAIEAWCVWDGPRAPAIRAIIAELTDTRERLAKLEGR